MRSADGSIQDLPGGRKRIRITVGYDPETGKQVRATRTIRGGRKQASDAMDTLKRQFHTASAVVYGRLSVYELAKEDIERRELAATTRRGYRQTLENHIRPVLEDVRLADVRRMHIVAALAHAKTPGARLNVFKLLRATFREALANEWITSNPMKNIDEPVVPEYSADTYTIDEVVAVLEFARGSAIEPGLIISAWCGLRLGETCALNRQDLVLEREIVDDETVYEGHVCVRENYVSVPGERITKGTKTERSKRDVALPQDAVQRLLELLGEDRIGPLMMDRTGQRMTPGGFSSRWRRLMLPRRNKAGETTYAPPVRYIELKNFRHSRITNLLELGQPLEWVSADAGHSVERTTETIYNRRRRQANKATAAAFDDALRARQEDRSSEVSRPNSS